MNSLERVLQFYERVVDLADPGAVIREVEGVVVDLLECGWAQVLLARVQPVPPGALVLRSPENRVVAYVATGPSEISPNLPGFQAFLKMAAWALLGQAREWSESLRLARKVIEEGLPIDRLRAHGWEAVGELRPAFHVGGDYYTYLLNEDVLCFLLLDAVGHGLSSALLAASCRSLWRGVVFEKDLNLAVRRLNQRLFEDTASEHFVAATLGYCFPDGSVEYVCCGQSPMFLLDHGKVTMLPECDPPLGLFDDWEFEVQRRQLKPGQALLSVTDGFLEWPGSDGVPFGEEGAVCALEVDFPDAPSAVERLFQKLMKWADGTRQLDDVACLCMWRD
jgi:serine phosphatase RsbU (regulator of sigma subunit)